MSLGKTIRNLRKEKGVGIKTMAPAVKIHHTYLSKIENGYIIPSAEVVQKLARYLNYDSDELMILANRIPDDILEILKTKPHEAMSYLREQFGQRKSDSTT